MARKRGAGSTSAEHEFPTCVRHNKGRKDVRLRHYHLCDACTADWTSTAFNGAKSLYDGEAITGYCLLCNQDRPDIRIRTWFLCDICDRVAKSIGRNHVAEMAIEQFWRSDVLPTYPNLVLTRNDIASLRPRTADSTSGEAGIDFICRDGDSIVFLIENKTGRSPIRGTGSMSAFQLDASDCDSITFGMTTNSAPAYIIHAEVLERWKPPTCGFYCRSLWWTDVYRMRDNATETRMRRDEGRKAVYFNKSAFDSIGSFRDQIYEPDGTLRLKKLFDAQGPIALYG